MYLHVGGDVMVRADDIVAILERDAALSAAATREFLGFMRSGDRVEDVAVGDCKAIVVCRDRVMLSPISAGTLRKRIGLFDDFQL